MGTEATLQVRAPGAAQRLCLNADPLTPWVPGGLRVRLALFLLAPGSSALLCCALSVASLRVFARFELFGGALAWVVMRWAVLLGWFSDCRE